jgi:subtilisin family serine protease
MAPRCLWFAVTVLLSTIGDARTSNSSELCRGSESSITVYKNGYGSGWIPASMGTATDAFSNVAVRSGTNFSLSSVTEPYAAFAVNSVVPFCKDSILDMWLQGTVLTRASVVLSSKRYGSVSEAVPLWIAEPDDIISSSVIFDGKLRFQEPDSEGWYRVSINLLDIANMELNPPSWDTITFQDNSGTGFSLYLSSAMILPNTRDQTSTEQSSCIGSVCNALLTPPFVPAMLWSQSSGPPMFGYSPISTTVAENLKDTGISQMIAEEILITNVKIRKWTTNIEIVDFCESIIADGLGKCFLDNDDMLQSKMEPQKLVEWPILSIKANSYTNLTLIRQRSGFLLNWMTRNQAVSASEEAESSYFAQSFDSSPGYNVSSGCPGIPWGLSRIDQNDLPIDKIYDTNYTGEGVHVYILDSGVNPHSDFENRLGVGVNCVSGTCKLGATEDLTGHGTHVAATVAGKCFGVAKKAIINPVKVLGGNTGNTGTANSVIQGIKWAVNTARANGWPAVINLSLIASKDPALNEAVAKAVSLGVTVVTAAGNDMGMDSCTRSPASAPAAFTTGATNKYDLAASFSNRGPCLKIWAPGNQIASADYQHLDNGYRVLSGTSMSAPHVSGAAALILSGNPSFSPSQVYEQLSNASVDKILAPDTTKKFLHVEPAF